LANISSELIAAALSSDRAVALAASRPLFTEIVEPLGDVFEPSAAAHYVSAFSSVLRQVFPELQSFDVEGRYARVSRPRVIQGRPETIFVLSRITLGADVAVTSVVLDAAKKRFPGSRICFVGPRKNAELFTDVEFHEIPYPRSGTLLERLSIWPALRELFSAPNSLVLDPDSRLTQLGLLPAGRDDDYHFFDSRSFGGAGSESLVELTRRWIGEPAAQAYIHTGLSAKEFAVTVSFGVGENANKRVADPFESEILKLLPQPILIDRGAGGEEAERAERAVKAAGVEALFWEGSFAGFAEHIRRSGLYVGYDSAGGHVAAACGVPMLSIARGFICERMFQRWRPSGNGLIEVIRVGEEAPAEVLLLARGAIRPLTSG
jgi:hypothetical protein